MAEKHQHAASLDAIGRSLVQSHYNLSNRGWQNWRQFGVPLIHRNGLTLLAQVNGKPLPNWGDA